MAFYDDKRFILSHIRHSFITCDDTSMCEHVMLSEPEDRYSQSALYHEPFMYSSDEEGLWNQRNGDEDKDDVELFYEEIAQLNKRLTEDNIVDDKDIDKQVPKSSVSVNGESLPTAFSKDDLNFLKCKFVNP